MIVFAGIFLLTRYWLRFYAVNTVLLQNENWNDDGVLMQSNRFTCVPASLVMLLKDSGASTTMLQITEMSGTNTEGTNPDDIIGIGSRFGFDVKKQMLDVDGLLNANLPAIVTFTWENSLHAVYVKPDQDEGWLVVKDPSMGLLHVNNQNALEYFGSAKVDAYLFDRKPS
jgi:ABC-type bacteriocin/lantibiotic exporter with double-glycine peptidase domain